MGYAEQEALTSFTPARLKELKDKATKAIAVLDHWDNLDMLYFSSTYEGEKTLEEIKTIKEALEAVEKL